MGKQVTTSVGFIMGLIQGLIGTVLEKLLFVLLFIYFLSQVVVSFGRLQTKEVTSKRIHHLLT